MCATATYPLVHLVPSHHVLGIKAISHRVSQPTIAVMYRAPDANELLVHTRVTSQRFLRRY